MHPLFRRVRVFLLVVVFITLALPMALLSAHGPGGGAPMAA